MICPTLAFIFCAAAVGALPSLLEVITNTNTSLASAVCTPDSCIVGINGLKAGARAVSSANGTTLYSTLLPGVYSSSSLAVASNGSSNYFTRSTVVTPSVGFNSTGAMSSSINIALSAGLTSYSNSLYQGLATFTPLSTNSSAASISSPSNSTPSSISSLLLSPGIFAVLSSSSSAHLVVYNSIADLSELPNDVLGSDGSATGIVVSSLQSSNCIGGCSSGGVCGADGKCICSTGFTGNLCNSCLPNYFGKSCQACVLVASGCSICEDGITGSGRCLSLSNSTSMGSASCNCVNGVCATTKSSTLIVARAAAAVMTSTTSAVASRATTTLSSGASSTCACNAGWSTASNGTACAACATGYFMDGNGQCLACDATCATCSSPLGTCLTCLPTLLPLSTSPTKCTPAPSRLVNSTTNGFITCPARSFFNTVTNSCATCDPLCQTCYGAGSGTCLSCRSGLGLLNGVCVAVDGTSGVCDSNGLSGGWVFDNLKGVCDALPPKCTAGSIDNFNPTSARSALRCSACLPGTFLVNGNCISNCPVGFVASGNSCVACDAACSSCSVTPTYCTTCSAPSQLALAGSCIAGPNCPSGFFLSAASTNSTSASTALNTKACSPCHPDCATCGTTYDNCLSCSARRPLLLPSSSASTLTCQLTCPSSSQYYNTATSACASCDSTCATCSASGSSSCTSCPNSSKLKAGSCVASTCSIVPSFAVCLSDLVTISSSATLTTLTKPGLLLPWYYIFLIILIGLLIPLSIFLYCRHRNQIQRQQSTDTFANQLDKKGVDLRLREMKLSHPIQIIQPPWSPLPVPPRHHRRTLGLRSELGDGEGEEWDREHDNEELRISSEEPRFILGHAPRSPPPFPQSRWSNSTWASSRVHPTPPPIVVPALPTHQHASLVVVPLVPQSTGHSGYSDRSLLSMERKWGDRNPFGAQ